MASVRILSVSPCHGHGILIAKMAETALAHGAPFQELIVAGAGSTDATRPPQNLSVPG